MHVPGMYRPDEPAWVIEIIHMYPLATLTVVVDGAPLASHVPMITGNADDPGREPDGPAGLGLVGHMNRANPQWRALRGGEQVLVVFAGPNAYISPTAYRSTPAAPTWNFAAVHVHGTIRPIGERERTLAVIKATVRAYERRLGTGWDMTSSLEYFDQLLPGVGAFEIQVERVDSMFKLSQEKPAEVRNQVADCLADDGRQRHDGLVAMMRRLDQPPARLSSHSRPADCPAGGTIADGSRHRSSAP